MVEVVAPTGLIFSVPVLVRFGPAEDFFDASTHSAGGLGLRRPDRLKHSVHMADVDIAHQKLAQDRLGADDIGIAGAAMRPALGIGARWGLCDHQAACGTRPPFAGHLQG